MKSLKSQVASLSNSKIGIVCKSHYSIPKKLNFKSFLGTSKIKRLMNMIKNAIIVLMAIMAVNACTSTKVSKTKSADTVTSNEPTVKDYVVGERWEYTWKTASEEKIRGEGKDIKEVVFFENGLGFSYGKDTVQITNPLAEKSATPNRDWPLEVGKKWRYESEAPNGVGDRMTIKQDAEVLSYGDVTVKAGTFKAFKIVYTGTVRNHKYSKNGAPSNDVWWYAPALKSHIKHTQDNGDVSTYSYVNELMRYSKPK
ncbi:MAG: hypothetical protein ACI9P5_004567 [Saprospiraceae bacterium]